MVVRPFSSAFFKSTSSDFELNFVLLSSTENINENNVIIFLRSQLLFIKRIFLNGNFTCEITLIFLFQNLYYVCLCMFVHSIWALTINSSGWPANTMEHIFLQMISYRSPNRLRSVASMCGGMIQCRGICHGALQQFKAILTTVRIWIPIAACISHHLYWICLCCSIYIAATCII